MSQFAPLDVWVMSNFAPWILPRYQQLQPGSGSEPRQELKKCI